MHVFARNFACQLEKALTELGQYQWSVNVLKDYVEKSFLKYINNDGVPCSDFEIIVQDNATNRQFHNKRLFNILCFINFYHLTFITFIYNRINKMYFYVILS